MNSPKNKISLIKLVLTALISTMVAIIPLQQSAAHNAVDGANLELVGDTNGSLFVATKLASTAVAHSASVTVSGASNARSTGLYYKSVAYATGTAQTATVVAGGLLSIYAAVATTSAISTDNGNIYGVGDTNSMVQTGTATGVAFTMPAAAAGTATPIAVIYQAPTTVGTAVISLTIGRLTAATIPTATSGKFLQGDEYTTITVTILAATNLSTSHFVANSSSNHAVVSGPVNASLLVATQSNTGGSAVAPSAANPIEDTAITSAARSSGLLSKSSTMATAQTATILSGGKLSLYANISTSVAFTASGGSFASTTQGSSAGTVTYSDPTATSLVVLTAAQSALGATAVGTLWTAPTTAGTYTVSLYKHSGTTAPTEASPSSGTLAAQITVTVVAASAGGAYSAAYSACYTKTTATDSVAAGTITSDSTSSVTDGGQWYIGYALNDGYGADLAAGSLIATATNGGIVNLGTDGGAVSAGTASTVVAAGTGNAHQIRVDQPTAGAPLTTTVTLTYNGTTVCTKTVSIAGVASTVTVSSVATGDLSSTTVNADWLSDPAGIGTAGARSGHYYVQLKDSAGNIVNPASSAEFSMDPATTTTTVTALAVLAGVATSTSSSSSYSKSVGTFTCGPAAGSSAVKLRHTSAATGVTITSPAFTARCADNPYTYTLSTDKAAYTQGEIGTMTVQFLDSKGNKANSVIAVGAVSMIMPMLTLVTATGSATTLTDADGVIKYTFTVGTSSGMTAGTYTGIVDFTGLTAVAAVKATPTYKLSSGTSDVAFSEVLKSVVALIASINKQIQALQKLILKR